MCFSRFSDRLSIPGLKARSDDDFTCGKNPSCVAKRAVPVEDRIANQTYYFSVREMVSVNHQTVSQDIRYFLVEVTFYSPVLSIEYTFCMKEGLHQSAVSSDAIEVLFYS